MTHNPQVEGVVSNSTAPAVFSKSATDASSIQQYMESQNVPVQFYGKVIDQKGKPLSGAKVRAEVRHLTVMAPVAFGAAPSMLPVQTETDDQGRFEISGVAGDGFDLIYIQKQGYELEMRQRSYAATGGNPSDPVVFRMWNINDHERLITGKHSFPIIPGGRT